MTTAHPDRPTWTNWVGNQSFTPSQIIEINAEEEIAPLIARAARERIGVRTPGAGHSFTPIVETGGLLLDMSKLRGVISIDRAKRQATAWPKTTVGDFGDPLWAEGLALSNQGDIDTQAIAGAIATATHGSGLRFPNFSAMLVGARFVDGLGNLVEVSADQNRDVLPALQTSLGLLGIFTRLTVQVVPAYELHARHLLLPYDALVERFDEFVHDYRSFSFFWLPDDASAPLYCLDKGQADDSCHPFIRCHPPSPRLGEGPGVRANEMTANERKARIGKG